MKIKQLRLQNNLSQTELAKIAQTSQRTISSYENSNATQNVEALIKIADYFHTTVDNLIDHNVPYLLDTSTFSDTQKNIIKMLKNLNDRQCDKVESYITGMIGAIETKNSTIEKFNKGESK